MFYQVKVPKHHANLMRLFWFNSSKTKIVEYRLNVHVFGATSLPNISNFALKQSIVNSSCSIEAQNSINQNFYVDDLLKSVAHPNVALKLLNEVKVVLKDSGFDLTSINSNSQDVLRNVSEHDLSDHAEVHEICCGETRVLGVVWKHHETCIVK